MFAICSVQRLLMLVDALVGRNVHIRGCMPMHSWVVLSTAVKSSGVGGAKVRGPGGRCL